MTETNRTTWICNGCGQIMVMGRYDIVVAGRVVATISLCRDCAPTDETGLDIEKEG